MYPSSIFWFIFKSDYNQHPITSTSRFMDIFLSVPRSRSLTRPLLPPDSDQFGDEYVNGKKTKRVNPSPIKHQQQRSQRKSKKIKRMLQMKQSREGAGLDFGFVYTSLYVSMHTPIHTHTPLLYQSLPLAFWPQLSVPLHSLTQLKYGISVRVSLLFFFPFFIHNSDNTLSFNC